MHEYIFEQMAAEQRNYEEVRELERIQYEREMDEYENRIYSLTCRTCKIQKNITEKKARESGWLLSGEGNEYCPSCQKRGN